MENNPIKVLQLHHDYNIMLKNKHMLRINLYIAYWLILAIILFGYGDIIIDNKLLCIGILINILFMPFLINKFMMKYFYPNYVDLEFVKIVAAHNLLYDPRILKFKFNELSQMMKNEHIFIENEKEKLCEICELNYSSIKLNCSGNGFHGGCEKCIDTWLKKDNSCPWCRKKIINFDKLLS